MEIEKKRRPGRPAGTKSQKTVVEGDSETITMRVKSRHLKLLDTIAEEQGYGLNRQDLIRFAIVDYIKNNSSYNPNQVETEQGYKVPLVGTKKSSADSASLLAE